MRPSRVLPVLIFALVILCLESSDLKNKRIRQFANDQTISGTRQHETLQLYEKNICFEPNVGQTDSSVRFISRGNKYALFLRHNEAILSLHHNKRNKQTEEYSATIQMQLEGANPQPEICGRNKLIRKTNYYIGNNPDFWYTDIENYSGVEYKGVYPGIDLVYYGSEGLLEYDFIISSEGNPKDIVLKFKSPAECRIDEQGNLVFSGENSELLLKKPIAYQEIENNRINIDSKFTFLDKNKVGFDVGFYNKNFPLIIDPVLVYVSYLGGTGNDYGKAIAVNKEGCAYVTGSTGSVDFPTLNSFQSELFPGMFSYLTDIFVTKFNAEGTDIIYSTYIGGRWDDSGDAIAVDSYGQAYITGRTSSSDDDSTPEYEGFPLMNPFQADIGDPDFSDAFITVLNSSGGLAYSSYLGGGYEDYGTDIVIDNFGCAYITGTEFSFDFPVKNAFMESKPSYYFDAFVTKVDPTKSGDESLIFSTHLGGSGDDYGNAIGVDGNGRAYVTGRATMEFPVTDNAIQSEYQGKADAFVTKFSADGSSLIYSTYLGDTNSTQGYDIEVDAEGHAYVYGSGRIPVTDGAYTTSGASFLCKINTAGDDFVYSTRIWSANKLALDESGNIYASTYFLGPDIGSGVFALNAEGTGIIFSHVMDPLNDMAMDANHLYFTGSANTDGLATEGAFQASLAGKNDVLVKKLSLEPSEDMLVVEILQDPVNNDAVFIPYTSFDIYSIDLSDPVDPLTYQETQFTDDKGLLYLPADYYYPGTPIFIRATPEKKPAVKKNRLDEDKYMYTAHIDNLIIDNNGNIEAQILEEDPVDTTRVYMRHTSYGFNLVVSIEWLASPDYINKLKSSFTKASNILYDITNGHAFLDRITIYDDTVHWDDADIHIFASNIQWPEAVPEGIKRESDANISLPPAMYDSIPESVKLIQRFYDADQIDPSLILYVTSIVHELGHYLFGFRDEYENHRRRTIYKEINFGFMDNPDNLNDPMSTEMSHFVTGDALFSSYSETEHYYFKDRNCWDYFKDSFDCDYGYLLARIHTPQELGITSGAIMQGPNSDPDNPDFSVGEMMTFNNQATTTTDPPRLYQFTDQLTGQPAKVRVNLEKQVTGRWIIHGKTTSNGHIKLFNAEDGDKILAAKRSFDDWSFRQILVGEAATKAANEVELIELHTVNGKFSLLSEMGFNDLGKPVYQCKSDPVILSSPSIRLINSKSGSEEQILSEVVEGTFSVELNDQDFEEGIVYFSAYDSLNETFFIPQESIVRNTSDLYDEYYFPGMQLKLSIDETETTAEKIALLASGFPAPKDGLPDSVLRVSDVICLNIYPNDSELSAQVQIYFSADSLQPIVPEALTIYEWDNGWIPLETVSDLDKNTVATTLDSPGFFVAYLNLTQSTIITNIENKEQQKEVQDFKLMTCYPNPFSQKTTINYRLANPGKVEIKVYNAIGQEIETLVNEFMVAGDYEITWQPKGMPTGVYFCKMAISDGTIIKKSTYIETKKLMFVK